MVIIKLFFFSKKGIERLALNFQTIFLQIEVGFYGWSQRIKQITFFFQGYFSKYGRPTTSIGDKHDMIFTESEFSLDSKWLTVNVSISSFLKLRLSRLFVTCSVVFLHFDMASESTGRAGSLSKVGKKSLNLKSKFTYSLIYTIFFIWGNVHRRWRKDDELAWFSGQHFAFSPHLTRAKMSFDRIAIQPPGASSK